MEAYLQFYIHNLVKNFVVRVAELKRGIKVTSKSRRKGNATVRKTRAYLEEQGYDTDTTEKTGRFVKQKDLFGLYDLISVKKGSILFVQCKTNRPATKKPLQEFTNKHNLYGACFTWYDRKGFLIQYYIPGKKQPKRVDLRKK